MNLSCYFHKSFVAFTSSYTESCDCDEPTVGCQLRSFQARVINHSSFNCHIQAIGMCSLGGNTNGHYLSESWLSSNDKRLGAHAPHPALPLNNWNFA